MIQLDLFEPDVLKLVLQELKDVKNSSEAVRKGVFRRVALLERKIENLEMFNHK